MARQLTNWSGLRRHCRCYQMGGTDHLMVGWTETASTPILTWDSWEGGRREGGSTTHESHRVRAGASSDRQTGQARPGRTQEGRKELSK